MIDQSYTLKFPTVYNFRPGGLPLYWGDDVSGTMQAIVGAYLEAAIRGALMDSRDLEILREYLVHHINAPCWDPNGAFTSELVKLRADAAKIDSVEKVTAWIEAAMEIGLDPL